MEKIALTFSTVTSSVANIPLQFYKYRFDIQDHRNVAIRQQLRLYRTHH